MLDLDRALAKATELLASALRDHFPEDSQLTDSKIVAKHHQESQVRYLGTYFARIEEGHAELARALLNIA